MDENGLDEGLEERPLGGDQISVGNIENSRYVAVGRGAAVYVGLSYDEVVELFGVLRNEEQPEVWDGRIPYLGLNAFQESDAQFFFGREGLVEDLLERVRESNFITIAGPSGSGKSSVARAGLFHALREGARRNGGIERSDGWLLGTMQPKGDPIEQLAVGIERMVGRPKAADHLREHGLTNPLALKELVETLLSDDARQRCVLLVDQFEEVFTQTKDEEARAAFIELLSSAVEVVAGRLTIILCLRSDFVSQCVSFPKLRALMSNQIQLVGAMEPRDLAKAITLPALEVGAEIDPALVKQIMDDMKGEPGALPLMSFALRDLFEAEKSGKGRPMDMTLREYTNRGGIEEALERHANKVFANFTDEQKALAENVFSKLIEVGQGRVDTRRTATFAELVPSGAGEVEVAEVVQELAREGVRLITTSGGEEVGSAEADTPTTVTVAHERLIDAWPWLRRLVDENRELIGLVNQINEDARDWEKEGDAGYLYGGGRLLQVEERLEGVRPNLDGLSLRFIEASIAERERREVEVEANRRKDEELRSQKRVGRILRGATAVVGVLLVIAIFLAFQANNSANLAATSEAGALAAEAEALEAKVTSDFNAELASTREILAVNAQGTSDANALLAVTSEAEAIAAEGVARAEASRAVIAEATAVAAQATSNNHAVQAIDLAQVRLANSNYLATAVARVDDALATQEAFFAADSNYEAQLIQVQSIRSSLNTVFAQNLQVGLVINPDIDTLTEDVYEGLDWVRLVFKLDAAEQESGDVESAVTRYEPLIEVFALQGISVLFILNQETFWGNAPWEGGDWDTYAAEMAANASNLARAMSNRYARYGALIAYEIWNEPDSSPTNPSSIPIPADVYAIILEQTAAAIKEASPEANIIFGSLTSGPSNGTAYVQRVRNELGGRLPVDAIGWKPYGRYGTFDPFYNEQFGTLQDWFEIFNDAFPDIPIWVTEIGVRNNDPIPAEYNPLIAAYILDVYNYIGTNFARQVPVVIWYAWSDWLANAGIVDKEGNPKDEIYDAFAEVRSGAIFDEQN